MLWYEHSAFTREFKRFSKKFVSARKDFEAVKKLLGMQFDPVDPKEIIDPGKIHRVHQNSIWELWKVEALVEGLKPSQWPRIWFVVSGNSVTFLVVCTHMDNYDNNEKDRLALARIGDLT